MSEDPGLPETVEHSQLERQPHQLLGRTGQAEALMGNAPDLVVRGMVSAVGTRRLQKRSIRLEG
jgi:hypothetical protein